MAGTGIQDDWDFYPLRVDDKPASIFVNLGYRRVLPVPKYADMAYVRIYMHQPREDGLSSDTEFDALSALGDALTSAAEAKGKSLYVGRNTSDGTRDFYFYTRDAKRFEREAQKAMAAFPNYTFDIGSRPDADWGTYLRFLYPDPRSLQRIKNRRVCEQLEQHGDDLTISRKIDHFAKFKSEEAARKFAEERSADGFEITGLEEIERLPGEWGVWFTRIDTPGRIDDVVIPLFDRIAELDGTYDGWGCEVQTPG